MAPLLKSTKKPRKNKKQSKYIPTKLNKYADNDTVIATQLFPNLLLAYTHFLNGFDKHISIGYNADTFQPAVNITHNPISTIALTTLDWMHLRTNAKEISNCFSYKNSVYFKCDSISISVIHSSHNDENTLIFQHLTNTLNCITLNELEWMLIIDLLDLYISIYDYCTLYTSNIKFYYEQYVQHCYNTPNCQLYTSDYFIIEDKSKITFNQLRLFYEIPIYCKNKLSLDVKLYKLYHK